MDLKLHSLDDRALLRVAGGEAFVFLQNLVTCDMREAEGGALLYGCLLAPQGPVLHDFFVFQDTDSFVLDCDAGGIDDLMRRFGTYKLRSKVDIGKIEGWKVYAGPEGAKGYADPRLPGLGFRIYTQEALNAGPGRDHDDLSISLGIAPPRAMKGGKDYVADLNLDLLHAVSFTKGCFVGQELTARMKHRGLVKRRLLLVEGQELAPGDRIMQGDAETGEVRAVDSAARRALALVRLEALARPGTASISGKSAITIHKPVYMLNKD
jgi:folate-binding protein YgfZ